MEIPADEAFFINVIKDGFLLTGRKSYESAQGSEIFNNRNDVIILTRNKNYTISKGLIARNLVDAFEQLENLNIPKVYILGGGKIYEQSILLADEMILTEIHHTFEGDTFFPIIDLSFWKELKRKDYPLDENNPYNYSFVWYERKN